jgi:hypothetical protein
MDTNRIHNNYFTMDMAIPEPGQTSIVMPIGQRIVAILPTNHTATTYRVVIEDQVVETTPTWTKDSMGDDVRERAGVNSSRLDNL